MVEIRPLASIIISIIFRQVTLIFVLFGILGVRTFIFQREISNYKIEIRRVNCNFM